MEGAPGFLLPATVLTGRVWGKLLKVCSAIVRSHLLAMEQTLSQSTPALLRAAPAAAFTASEVWPGQEARTDPARRIG